MLSPAQVGVLRGCGLRFRARTLPCKPPPWLTAFNLKAAAKWKVTLLGWQRTRRLHGKLHTNALEARLCDSFSLITFIL